VNDLERLEDECLKTVKQSAVHANTSVQAKWATVPHLAAPGETGTGAQVDEVMERFAEPARNAIRKQGDFGMKAACVLVQNFATLANGMLIGLSEGLQVPKAASRCSQNVKA